MLREAFDALRESRDGAQGVWMLDSGAPGPVVGITVGTHGNEPAGLAVYNEFRRRHAWNIQKGTVIFVLNNPAAMRRYFEALDAGDDQGKIQARFTDLNMNRLPDVLSKDDARYEVRRAYELQRIWARFDYALDIHSTLSNTLPMVVALDRSDTGMVRRFPIETVLAGIEKVQSGKPACYFYGDGRAAVYGIEAGGHEASETFPRAVTCAETFLAKLGVIDREHLAPKREQRVYRVFDAVRYPDAGYELVKPIQNFELITKGQVIANGSQGPIVAPADCCALMPQPGVKPIRWNEEIMFLAHPPEVLGL